MTKADLIAGLKRSPVPFEAGGLSLRLLPWTVATRTEFALWRAENAGPVGLYAKLAALSVCDESGALILADAAPAELEALDGLALEAIAERVLELNGMGASAAKN